MYQPSGSRTVGEFTQEPATTSSNGRRSNKNSHLMPNPNVRVNSLVSNPYLPPPPSYFSPHNTMNCVERSEPKYLSNWCVSVNNFEFDAGLIAELSGKKTNIVIFKCLTNYNSISKKCLICIA